MPVQIIFQGSKGPSRIQPEVCPALVGIGAMTFETAVRQQRSDVQVIGQQNRVIGPLRLAGYRRLEGAAKIASRGENISTGTSKVGEFVEFLKSVP